MAVYHIPKKSSAYTKHSYIGRGSQTKGSIMDCVTGEKRGFFFNPSEISYSRSANYSEITSPGLSNPLVQYVSGNSMHFSFPLFFYDKPYTGLIPNWEKFFNNFLPPIYNKSGFKKPNWLLLAMGNFVQQCVVESIDYNYTEFNKTLHPTVGTITLNLRSLGAN